MGALDTYETRCIVYMRYVKVILRNRHAAPHIF